MLKGMLKDHIDAVLGRYGNDLYAFDVINERQSNLAPNGINLTPLSAE